MMDKFLYKARIIIIVVMDACMIGVISGFALNDALETLFDWISVAPYVAWMIVSVFLLVLAKRCIEIYEGHDPYG